MKMSVAQLNKAGYLYHHSASERGYTRVSDIGLVIPYTGKYGQGYKRYIGCYRGSTQYTTIEYWIK